MDIVSLLIYRAISGGGGETPVATDISYDNTTSGLSAENVQSAIDELSSEKIDASEKGTANGVAELNENGIILTSQLPSYVDDVLEYNTYSDFPQEGESGKVYVDISTNKTYRWGGSEYVEISPSLALGETSSTAYRGDRGKIAYDHSQLTTGNPHNVTKAQIGLGNVDNTSDANKPISTATQAALDTKLSENDLYNMTEDSTVSGNPVTLKTLAKTSAKSCEVTMNPIQDLHGYDSPWVGGAGKNKFDYSSATSSDFTNNNGTFTSTKADTKTAFTWRIRTRSGSSVVNTYNYPSNISSVGRYYMSFTTESGENVDSIQVQHSGSQNNLTIAFPFTLVGTFTMSIEFTATNPSTVGGVVFNNIQIENGSSMTSYEPYSNICPISGRTEVNVTRTGKNLLDESTASIYNATIGQYYVTYSATSSSYFIKVAKNETYSVSMNNSSATIFRCGTVDSLPNAQTSFDNLPVRNYHAISGGTGAFTVETGNDEYLVIQTSQVLVNARNCNIQLELGSTATAYEPYQGETHTATLGSTYYGGKLDMVSGKLIATHGIVDFVDLSWTYDSNYSVFFANATNCKYIIGTITCISSCYKVANRQSAAAVDMSIYTRQSGANTGFGVKDSGYTDADTFKTARTGQKICYELATPQEITLTPETIALLKGNNVLWTDGDSVKIVYEKLDLTELPDVTSADEGKVLTVNSSGEWVAQTLPDGTNISY